MNNVALTRPFRSKVLVVMPKEKMKNAVAWTQASANRMIEVRSELSVLMFTSLARLSTSELLNYRALKKELAQLEKLRNYSSSARPTS